MTNKSRIYLYAVMMGIVIGCMLHIFNVPIPEYHAYTYKEDMLDLLWFLAPVF
jgi:hypothetical protein